jgi:hypothetical protein
MDCILKASDSPEPLASEKPRTALPITQEITTIKTEEKGFSLGFSPRKSL